MYRAANKNCLGEACSYYTPSSRSVREVDWWAFQSMRARHAASGWATELALWALAQVGIDLSKMDKTLQDW